MSNNPTQPVLALARQLFTVRWTDTKGSSIKGSSITGIPVKSAATKRNGTFIGKCVFLLSSLILTMALCSVARAEDKIGQTLEDLYKLQLQVYESADSYIRYRVKDLDPALDQEIDDALERGDQLLQKLPSLYSDIAFQETIQKIQKEWKNYKKLMVENRDRIRTQGYAEAVLESEMMKAQVALSEKVAQANDQVLTSSQYQIDPLVRAAREQSLAAQSIGLLYLRLVYSDVIWDPALEENNDIVIKIDRFKDQLQTLKSQYSHAPAIDQQLSKAWAKFRFMENSLRNYKQNAIPDLVSRYTSNIVDNMEQVEVISDDRV